MSESPYVMFTPWNTIDPTTPLRDLFATSLLVLPEDPRSGVLLRCSAGMEEGSAVVVHAATSSPNALRMIGVDEDTPIGSQAQALVADQPARVVAIPHITWKHPGAGTRWRTPGAVALALATVLTVARLHPPLSVLAAVPLGAVLGLVVWLMLRGRVPTRITQMGDAGASVRAVVEHALACTGDAGPGGPVTPGPVERIPGRRPLPS